MFYRICPAMLSLVMLAGVARAQNTRPTSLPAGDLIPRATLDQMYRVELGNLYKPTDAAKFLRAGELIERYFNTPRDRREIVTLAFPRVPGYRPLLGAVARLRRA